MLHETGLPSRDQYFNTLTNSELSESDYQRASHIYKALAFSSLFDQARFYQKIDIYLLIDVFNAFRVLVMKEFSVEALSFMTLPSMAFSVSVITAVVVVVVVYVCMRVCYTYHATLFFSQIMLRQTGVEIDLCSDETMYLWLESHLRVC